MSGDRRRLHARGSHPDYSRCGQIHSPRLTDDPHDVTCEVCLRLLRRDEIVAVHADPDVRSEWEETARAVKAHLIARVLSGVVDEHPGHLVDVLAELEDAPGRFRRRVCTAAGVRLPASDLTWRIAVEMIRAERTGSALGPFLARVRRAREVAG